MKCSTGDKVSIVRYDMGGLRFDTYKTLSELVKDVIVNSGLEAFNRFENELPAILAEGRKAWDESEAPAKVKWLPWKLSPDSDPAERWILVDAKNDEIEHPANEKYDTEAQAWIACERAAK